MSIRRLFSIILLLALFGFSVRVPRDPDMWWHLRTGEYILEEGIPQQDPPFSFTVTDHEWITHEWLTQVFMIGVYRNLGGLYGLALIFALLVTAAFGLLYYSSVGQPYVAGFITFWGISASLPFINTRPQMFNILFGAYIIFVMERIKQGKLSSKWIWSFPVLIALWVNMHGGFLLGIVIMGVYFVGEGLQRLLPTIMPSVYVEDPSLSWPDIINLTIVTTLSVFTALINPNGYRMWGYAFETLTSDAMRDTITEWQSPNFHIWYFWFFGFMMLGAWILMVASRRPLLFSDVLFLFGTSFAGLQSVRNIPLFALVAIPIMSRHLLCILSVTSVGDVFSGERPDPSPTGPQKIMNWSLALLVAFGIVVYSVQELSKMDETIVGSFPVEAVDYIEAEGLTDARIFNDYEWGGYLIWRDIPTFIDGRADLFGDEFIYFYMQTYRQQADWEEPLDEFDVSHILTRKTGGLTVLLDASDTWEPIYEDDLAFIYVRQDQ